MSSKIPPLLEPYLALPPESSLILLTSVLGASTNWLVLRLLYSALLSTNVSSEFSSDDGTKVVLVSFIRDFAFWKENAKRLGLDLEKLIAQKRFSFVDGLSGLYLPEQNKVVFGRSVEHVITSPTLENTTTSIRNAIQNLKGTSSGSKVLLIIDQLDTLLATSGGDLGAIRMGDALLKLRDEVHSVVLSLSADSPLVSLQETPLEIDHAAFLINTAHQADFTLSLRLLDSGTARDVSGVIRITLGDQATEISDSQRRIEEREFLYFVGGDGGVKVFERGQ